MEKFLSCDIKCISCGSGPISFSITWDNNQVVTKYGNYCSMGCLYKELKNGNVIPKKIEIDLR